MIFFGIIDKFHTWSNSLIKERFPRLSLYYYYKPRYYFKRRSQPVHRLVNGISCKGSDKKSIIFFTVHKSASTFLVHFLEDLSNEVKLTYVDFNGYFIGREGQSGRLVQEGPLIGKVFSNEGYLYGPLRNYIEIPEMQKYAVVLLLRDPRDVLTSQYYSVRNTHPQVSIKYIERRKLALNMTVDEHVIHESDRFLKTYSTYIDELLALKNVLFLKYEDMISDFDNFLILINKHGQLQLSEQQLKKLNRSSEFKPQQENLESHKRKIASGDYKEKLKPATIILLNKKFENILQRLQYNV